ncbi:PEP-CTERM sorting domain-containing protein [Microcystis aeruginosa CS-338/01]|uniref:PEP-CTERM sorting domain-containing protein n=1 Tax=Microcystis aeruginosa TaxID=1126 RepID=UPI00232F5077|nr:PEP-CTERM sorting domain-containing protein [Microcystis aeruginosa]MDB9507278.1 PEP-CTERM sorting domain-containing protein [Microcystis aeruginosa CS-338/01]
MITNISRQLTTGVLAIAGSVAALSFAGAAQAASIVQTATLPNTTTNFTNTPLSGLTQFDSSLGTLNSVIVTLDATVAGTVALENIGPSASSITYNLQASVAVSSPSVGSLLTSVPVFSGTFNASPFDGTLDFGGTSGTTISNLTANASQTTTLTTGLTPFIGSGALSAFLSGIGQSNASGSGNIASVFTTQAGGTVTVQYNYTPAATVPEPSAILGILAVAGIGSFARRKS